MNPFDDLEKLTDDKLQEIYLTGETSQLSSSTVSAAKRLLDIRTHQKHQNVISNLEKITLRLETSHKGIRGLADVFSLVKKFWLPNQPTVIKLTAFLFGTVLLGIMLNLVADAIAKFVFHW